MSWPFCGIHVLLGSIGVKIASKIMILIRCFGSRCSKVGRHIAYFIPNTAAREAVRASVEHRPMPPVSAELVIRNLVPVLGSSSTLHDRRS